VPGAKGECVRGSVGEIVSGWWILTHLAFILHPKLYINGVYDWGGRNEKWDAYRASRMVRVRG